MIDSDRSRQNPDEEFFKQYTVALKMWCKRFNTAEIAKHLNVDESIVCQWIWHWRELSRGPTA